ncbi:MAG: hypothetical protein PHD01_06730 [Geobacteraceae bacterium]|nr:hypothetical protein [Geobacteraceae bacterium]
MNSSKYAVYGIVVVCALALTGEAFAAGGQRMRQRDGSCLRTSTMMKTQTRTQDQTKTQSRQRLQDGSGSSVTAAGAASGQGQMRQAGPGDGTGNETRPLDGTGYGSPNK